MPDDTTKTGRLLGQLCRGSRFASPVLCLLWAGLLAGPMALAASGAQATEEPIRIDHPGIECFPRTEHSILRAVFEPSDQLAVARVSFRAAQYDDFYSVEMTREGGNWRAILPKPDSSTEQVVYFIDAEDRLGRSSRTSEFTATVVEHDAVCKKQDPDAAFYRGEPDIAIQSASSELPVPPGFQSEGIVDFTFLAATAAATGGGLGGGTWLALGAGAAAVASVGILATGDSSTPDGPSNPVDPEPPEPPPETLPPVVACFDSPQSAAAGASVRIDASCATPRSELSYQWDLGDGRRRTGRVINPIYQEPGVYIVALSVQRGRRAQLGGSGFDRQVPGDRRLSGNSHAAATRCGSRGNQRSHEHDLDPGGRHSFNSRSPTCCLRPI